MVVREDVKRTAPINYLYEHADEFPGVSVTNTYIRYYPHGDLAAHVLGYVNEISAAQLKALQRKGYAAGDKIGEAGVEASYDSYLRGHAGLEQLRVDSLGRPRSPLVTKRQPAEGESIKLTIDSKLQRKAEEAIRYGIDQAYRHHHWQANGGAIVALDPRDGSIRAMASYPTYNPSIYTGHVTTKRLAAAGLSPSTAERDNFRSLDRASNGVYPAGSTFKPVTALAAMETGKLLPSTPLDCTGSYTVYSEFDGSVSEVFHNVDPYINESMTLPTALAASCDTWFYQLGYEFYKAPASEGHPLQAWAAKFGFGRKTGVDVGPESAGLLPTPEWRKRAFTAKTDPGNWQIDNQWKPGDSIQLAIGQKDLLVTPLQMARFYAAIANNGKLVRPHLAMQVEEGGGTPKSPPRVVHNFPAAAPQSLGLDPTYLAAVQDGLWQATHSRRRNLDERLRHLPDPDRGQDRHCAEGSEHRPEGSVLVVRLRAGGEHHAARARGLRADRERRLRRRRGRARRVAGLQGVLQEAARLRAGDAMIEAVGTRARGLRTQRPEAVEATSAIRRLDWWLVGATAGLLAFGLWAIHGITAHDVTGNPDYFFVRQGIYAAVGVAGALALLFVDPQFYRRHMWAIYIGTTGVMLLVLLTGTVSRHSKRWLDIGFFRFQPSEFGKLLFVLFLAAFLADRAKRLGESRTVLETIGLGLVPILLVFVQPDIGTAMVYTAALAAVLFVAGIRWVHLAALGIGTLVVILAVLWLLPASGVHLLKDYQAKRLTGFTHPDSDPAGATYNVAQARNAVGAGGVNGRGVAGATQTKLNFLPEHATDFAFASLAEQRGFVGVSVLLLLYLLVVWRGLKVIAIARDAFSAIAAGGIVFAFLFQVFVNVGMNIGVAPVTGIPLPFVSVGGSALIASLLAVGVLQAIHIRGAARPKAYR